MSVRSRPGTGSWAVMEMVALVVAISRRGRRMKDSNLVLLNRGERTEQQVSGGEGVAGCVRPRRPAASSLCGYMEGSHDGDARPRAFTMFPVHLPSPLCSPCPTSDTP